MEVLNGRWELVGSWRTTPNGAVCRATRRGKRYVVKRLPRRFPELELMREYPHAYLERLLAAQECLCHQLRVHHALTGGALAWRLDKTGEFGNLNVDVDVFRDGTGIYKVARYVDPARVGGQRLTAGNVCRLLAPAQLNAVLRSVAFQVGRMGAAGFVHNDLKPQNVLFAEVTPGVFAGCVIDCDSGFFTGKPPAPGDMVGATEYASPEVVRYLARGVEDPALAQGLGCASDVFSLGVLFYEYLTGRQLADEAWRWPAERIACRMPVDLSALDERHRRMIRAMLNPDPTRRPTARDVVDELGRTGAVSVCASARPACIRDASMRSAATPTRSKVASTRPGSTPAGPGITPTRSNPNERQMRSPHVH